MCDAVGWLVWGHGDDRGGRDGVRLTELAAGHRVIRYDRRGFGGTRGESGEHAHYEDLLALLDARGIEQAALVGASMGGACALDAALAAPERITRLVLLGSGLTGPPDDRGALPRRPPHPLPGPGRRGRPRGCPGAMSPSCRPRCSRWCGKCASRCTGTTGRRHSGRNVSRDTRHRLAEITTPALVVIGTEDAPGLVELSTHLAYRCGRTNSSSWPTPGTCRRWNGRTRSTPCSGSSSSGPVPTPPSSWWSSRRLRP